MNDADPLIGLHDIRLPADAPYQLAADILAALGVGLVFALLLWPVLLWVTRARTPRATSIDAELERLAKAPESTRVPALLRLLEERQPGRSRAFGSDLYAPGKLPSARDLEQIIRQGG